MLVGPPAQSERGRVREGYGSPGGRCRSQAGKQSEWDADKTGRRSGEGDDETKVR
jgi:hypothetical protein